MTAVGEGSFASLDVTRDRLVLETGCNTASATMVLGDADLEVTEMVVTEHGCPADRIDQGRLQLAALDGGLTWSVDDGQLRLGNDRIVLLYDARR